MAGHSGLPAGEKLQQPENFDGTMDLSILIRTITAGKGWWQFPVGGGIVAQSNPEREYVETWEKATGMLRALG